MRLRAYWVSKQTEVRNKIRTVGSQREEVRLEVEKRDGVLFSLKGLEFLGGLQLPERDQLVLDDLLGGHREIRAHVKVTDGLVKALYGELEEAARIDTVPGFARTLSVLVAVEIADIRRFARPADLHPMPGSFLDARLGEPDGARADHQARERLAEVGGRGSGHSGDQEGPGTSGPVPAAGPEERSECGQDRGGPEASDHHLSSALRETGLYSGNDETIGCLGEGLTGLRGSRSGLGLGAEIECYSAHYGADRRVVRETEAA
jgi:hypothetical protein